MTRHALLVGIDRYPGFPERNQLASCARDARLVAEVLRDDFEFPAHNVELLVNEEATRQGILDALEDLARRVGPGDAVVFYYSGHGSEARDRPGGDFNIEVEESTEWEQTLVPCDSGREKRLPYRDIRDDEIYLWIREVNETTPYVTVILDSCHAGTAVRSSVRIKRVPREPDPGQHRAPDYQPFRIGESRGESRIRSSAAPGKKRWRDIGASGWLPVDERYTLLAACHHTESAKEYEVPGEGGRKHGLFTWHLVGELRRIAPGATYRELMEAVRRDVHAVDLAQTPQVEGAYERRIFGAERAEPRPFVAGGSSSGIDHPKDRERFLRLERLVERAPTDPLAERVEVTLLRWEPAEGGERNGNGKWLPAEPDVPEGEPTFREGDQVALELKHRYEYPLYLHVFDVGLTGAVRQLHPVAGESQAQEPGRTVRIGTRPGEGLTVRVPADFAAPEGRERIRVFAGMHPTEPTDRESPAADGPWTAVTRSFVVVRAGAEAES